MLNIKLKKLNFEQNLDGLFSTEINVETWRGGATVSAAYKCEATPERIELALLAIEEMRKASNVEKIIKEQTDGTEVKLANGSEPRETSTASLDNVEEELKAKEIEAASGQAGGKAQSQGGRSATVGQAGGRAKGQAG